MGRTSLLSPRAAELLVVAFAGAGLALGGAALLGKLGSHTTTVEQVAAPTTISARTQTAVSSGLLSPEQIYKLDSPGVVQITATTVTQVPADPFNFVPSSPETSQSLGSGFVIDRAGHI